ncbi:hypothetical protein RchiOBHm_Chr4g0397931 [Rosa chinensis]|uniref:Uncharacterized protein n=1 Tax=Rosa chinensis TaxID=74649 RepID=A0A2P6QS50_ROSCH|nr:hypothetical protein RchiOBHm_Chr4g0397931 [Rosa chinensis]
MLHRPIRSISSGTQKEKLCGFLLCEAPRDESNRETGRASSEEIFLDLRD